ncbi:hypothetical protein, partial [Corynebacterium striatum]|uniref:hypothetical protein n=1 Tax=Corynebacterium striatum TaxID=43770 RepID=UPI003B5D03F0
SVVIDKLEADHQRVSLSKIFRGLAQDIAFFAQLRDFFFELADPFGIIRRLGFIMHSFNARTLSSAVLLDPRMQRGTVDTELC